ncbi:MAG: hypothetical protein ACI9V1_001540 [Spirosomataceae bacterium]|jgi:hypothetical protein
MDIEQLYEAEKRRMDKMHLQLPNIYKKVGIVVFTVSMLILLSTKFIDGEIDTFKMVLRQIVIASMLVIAISKEKIEDEMIMKIRHRAFTIAFIWTVIYVLVQPYINYGVALIVRPERAVYEEFGSFIIMWFMLAIYLLYFHVMKRIA